MNDIPQEAYILPDEKTGYIAVWQTDTSLFIRILQTEVPIDLKLDKKILPHLVDALIDLQNQKPKDKALNLEKPYCTKCDQFLTYYDGWHCHCEVKDIDESCWK